MPEFTEEDRKRMEKIHEHVDTLNREMGEVGGELKWIRYVMLATFLASLADLIKGFLP